VSIQAEDSAGNQISWSQSYLVSNKPPQVSLSPQWYIWETGTLTIQRGDLPIQSARVAITSDQYGEKIWHYAIEEEQWQHEIVWDRKINDILMPPGQYNITVTVTDTSGQQRTASGVILIPQPPVNTATTLPTITSTTTPTIQATKLQATATPTSAAASIQQKVPSQVPPELPTPYVMEPQEQADQHQSNQPIWLALSLGFFLVFALSQSLDNRPTALNNLQQFINNLHNRGNYE
jgi:hypothetical protein